MNTATFFDILRIVGDFEETNDRPWIQGLVVGKDNKPGAGFFYWCKKYIEKSRWKIIDTPEFYEEVKESCYAFWNNADNYQFYRKKPAFTLE